MSFTLEQQVQNNTDRLDALKKINELSERVSVDQTEKMVVSVPDGGGGFVEQKVSPNLFLKGNFLRKTANYELVDNDKDGKILFEGNNLSLNLPLDLGWSNGNSTIVIVYGVNFTITNDASVVVKKPLPFQNINNAFYIITKTDSNEFSVVQIPSSTLTNINDTIRGGVVHVTGLTYFLWANRYPVNGVVYTDYISDTITLTDGDSVDPRTDVIAIELIDLRVAPAEFVIIEGTPAPSPIKPLVDSTTQTEFTFRNVNQNETSDPDVISEVVYDENAEWTNTFLLTGGDLDSIIDPVSGSKHALVVDGTLPGDPRIVWNKGSLIDFDINGKLVFYLQTQNRWNWSSEIRIKISNSTNGAYWYLQLNRNNVINYGFYDDLSIWQLVDIELSDFTNSSRSNTQFDTIEFTFGDFELMYMDWVVFKYSNPAITTTGGNGDMLISTYDPAGKSEQVLTESDLLDEDDMVSDSATKGATQQSIKAFVDAAVASGIADGDKGDVTVSGSGTVWTIDNDAVTYAKMQNVVANNVILGNNSGAGGIVDELTATEVRTILNVENGADVTDATNVASAGAVMDGDFSSNGILERTSAGVYGVVTKPTGALVGVSDSQTLTNKTIAYGSNTITGLPCEFMVAVSDETTNLTTGTAKVTFRMPYAMTLQAVRSNVNTAPTGSPIIVDINESGTTILSTKLSIDASEKTSTTAATPVVISDTSLADDAEITIDIDQVGSTIAGKGLKVTFKGIRA